MDDFIHKEMMKLFKFYCVVGGMPAVVQAFIQTKDMGKVINEQKGILRIIPKGCSKIR